MSTRSLPSLSLVLPNYNHGHLIGRALGAVLDQPVVPDEIIVIDDASTDDSADIIDSIARSERRIRFVRNPENLGCMASNNHGYRIATGDYIVGLSADDLPCRGLYQRSLELLSAHPEAGLCCADILLGYEENTVLHRYSSNWLDVPDYLTPVEFARVMPLGWMSTHTVVARRELVVRSGGHDPGLSYLADWFTYTTLGLRHGLCYIPEPLAIWTMSDDSWSNKLARSETLHQDILALASRKLASPEYADVASLFAISGAFGFIGHYLEVLTQAQIEPASPGQPGLLASAHYNRWARTTHPVTLHVDHHERRAARYRAAHQPARAASELCSAMSVHIDHRLLHSLIEVLDELVTTEQPLRHDRKT